MRDNLVGSALTETSLLVLLSLFEKRHGYGIKKWTEEKTFNRVVLGMGTLYGAINNLLDKKWIREHSQENRRVYYIIEEEGKKQVYREKKRILEINALIDEIMDNVR